MQDRHLAGVEVVKSEGDVLGDPLAQTVPLHQVWVAANSREQVTACREGERRAGAGEKGSGILTLKVARLSLSGRIPVISGLKITTPIQIAQGALGLQYIHHHAISAGITPKQRACHQLGHEEEGLWLQARAVKLSRSGEQAKIRVTWVAG